MGESNESWGSAPDDTTASLWDSYSIGLPDAALQLAATKDLSLTDLTRIGTRWSVEDSAFAWMFPGGIKYRRMDGHRWTQDGFDGAKHKLLHPIGGNTRGVIVAEGETDGAWLRREFPAYTIAIVPSGAHNIRDTMVQELQVFEDIYIALDNDQAGNAGAKKYMDKLPRAERMVPPGEKDWCAAGVSNPEKHGDMELSVEQFLVAPEDPLTRMSVFLQSDFGTKSDNQFFEEAICQRKGMTVVHGKKKSLKSVIALELVRALATGTPFAGYIPYIFARPARVAIVQFEVPPFSFQERAWSLLPGMTDEQIALFNENVFVHTLNDDKLPRMKMDDPDFLPHLQRLIQPVERGPDKRPGIDVILFDPVQRMTGKANQSQSNEMDPLFDACGVLQNDGLTTILCHHNNKASGKSERDPDSMTGTQRFSGDADAIASVWYDDEYMKDDRNPHKIKERNFDWEVRSGGIPVGRGVRVRPADDNPERMAIEYVEQHGPQSTADVAHQPAF